MFGRRHAPASPSRMPVPPVDSDGRRRLIGEAIFAEHKDFFNAIGFTINDPRNLLVLDRADFDRAVGDSLKKQGIRRQAIMDSLRASHGCDNIRPFFLFSEGIYNTDLGVWLVQILRMMPYDDWNTTYLPMDARTAAAMRLPLHPQQSIAPIEQLIRDRISPLRQQYVEAKQRVDQQFALTHDTKILQTFFDGLDRTRQSILDWAAQITPLVVKMIAEVQSKR